LREALLAAGVVPRPTVVDAIACLDKSLEQPIAEPAHSNSVQADRGRVGLDFPAFMRTVGTFCVLPTRALVQLLLFVLAPRMLARRDNGSGDEEEKEGAWYLYNQRGIDDRADVR